VVTPAFTDSLIAPFVTFYNQIRMRGLCDTEEMILAWQLQIWVSSSRSAPSSGPLEPDPIMNFEGGSSSTFYLLASAGLPDKLIFAKSTFFLTRDTSFT
jgi:hypothetical protein